MRKLCALLVFAIAYGVAAHSQAAAETQKNRPPIDKKSTESREDASQPDKSQQPTADGSPVIIYINPAGPQHIQTTYSTNQPEDKGDVNWWDRWRNEPINVLTGLIALGTLLLVIVTFMQVRITKINATATQRAFVYLKTIEFRRMKGPAINSPTTEYLLFPVWENSGETPTKRFRSYVSAKITGPEGLHSGFDFKDVRLEASEASSQFALGPKSIVGAARIPLSVAKAAPIILGQERLFIWGWCNYRDIFKKTPKHRTEFCVEIILVQTMFPENTEMHYKFHSKYNGADEECMTWPAPPDTETT